MSNIKIAVFGDVHANLPALEAITDHIHKQQPDAVYCLGDLVNQNIWNNEVVEYIRENQVPCVRGNHDEGIGNNKSVYSFAYGSQEEIEWGLQAIAWTLQQVNTKNKEFLRSLPFSLHMQIEVTGGKLNILIIHGSPFSNKERIHRNYIHASVPEYMSRNDIHLLLSGNTHTAFHKTISEIKKGKTVYRHIINPGSAGYPKDGSWHATYAIIHIDTAKEAIHDSTAIQVDFYRLAYDIDKVIKAIRHSPLSIYYAGRLLKY